VKSVNTKISQVVLNTVRDDGKVVTEDGKLWQTMLFRALSMPINVVLESSGLQTHLTSGKCNGRTTLMETLPLQSPASYSQGIIRYDGGLYYVFPAL
jgi:hypothetical protein